MVNVESLDILQSCQILLKCLANQDALVSCNKKSQLKCIGEGLTIVLQCVVALKTLVN